MLTVLAGVGACAADSSGQSPAVVSGSCGIRNPVHLASLSSGDDRTIAIIPEALLDREMTDLLTGWEAGLRVAAIYHLDETVTSLVNASSYSCRNIRGGSKEASGRLSRHAKGLALDVSGFKLADGRVIRVIDHWGKDSPEGRFLRAAHKAACRHFPTVLGPRYNAAHRDHFHLAGGGGSGFCR